MNYAKFFGIADAAAALSKDRSTKVGAVAIGSAGQVLGVGYNGFPRGADDNLVTRHERPTKYIWTEHAERNLIYNAARHGISLAGATIVVSGLHPCADCARAIVQSGIIRVLVRHGDTNERWVDSIAHAADILRECGVLVEVHHVG